jgi:hypothetical protein
MKRSVIFFVAMLFLFLHYEASARGNSIFTKRNVVFVIHKGYEDLLIPAINKVSSGCCINPRKIEKIGDMEKYKWDNFLDNSEMSVDFTRLILNYKPCAIIFFYSKGGYIYNDLEVIVYSVISRTTKTFKVDLDEDEIDSNLKKLFNDICDSALQSKYSEILFIDKNIKRFKYFFMKKFNETEYLAKMSCCKNSLGELVDLRGCLKSPYAISKMNTLCNYIEDKLYDMHLDMYNKKKLSLYDSKRYHNQFLEDYEKILSERIKSKIVCKNDSLDTIIAQLSNNGIREYNLSPKYEGNIISNDKVYFKSLLKYTPSQFKEYRYATKNDSFNQPNFNSVIALCSWPEGSGIRLYCLLTDSSIVNKSNFYFKEGMVGTTNYHLTFHSSTMLNALKEAFFWLYYQVDGAQRFANIYQENIGIHFYNTQGEFIAAYFMGTTFSLFLSTLKNDIYHEIGYQDGKYLGFARRNPNEAVWFNNYVSKAMIEFFKHPFPSTLYTRRRSSVRKDDSMNSELICMLPANYKVKPLSFFSKWFKIEFVQNNKRKIGWIHKSNLNL